MRSELVRDSIGSSAAAPSAGAATQEVPAAPYRRILLGYYPRREARDALVLARELARLNEAKLIFAIVFEYGPGPMGRQLFEAYLKEDSKRIFESVAPSLDGLDVEVRPAGGDSPGRLLHGICDEEDVDLAVVGKTHRGPIGRAVHAGGTGERFLEGASCALAVAPHGLAREGWTLRDPVGVAFDGSPESWLALEQGAHLAALAGVPLSLVGVVEPPMLDPWGFDAAGGLGEAERQIDGWASARRERLAAALEQARQGLPDTIEATSVLLDGDPADRLIAKAASGLGLLLVGSRGYGPARRLVAGSVSSRVMREASCPVIVVPRVADREGRV